MRWFFPSWNGDLRIEATPDGRQTTITLIEPTAYEMELAKQCQNVFRAKGWIHKQAKLWRKSENQKEQQTLLDATLLEVGLIVLGRFKPGIATLTAITDEEGNVAAMGSGEAGFMKWIGPAIQGHDRGHIPRSVNFRDTEGYAERQAEVRAAKEKADAEAKRKEEEAVAGAKRKEEEAAAEAKRKAEAEAKRKEGEAKLKAATSVKRPTPCCPSQIPGVVEPAQEVLLDFCTPEQRHQWLTERRLIAVGGITGHRYLLAHRHTPTAVKIGKICYDLDDEAPMHFHDWTVPPEEEVLASKLILEHREPWLRNEATTFANNSSTSLIAGGRPAIFKNPFGDFYDGLPDSGFTDLFGKELLKEIERRKGLA